MLTASLKSVLGRKLRLLMSAFAVILGVAFVAGTFIFTDTLGKSFDDIVGGTTSDVVVRPTGSDGFSSTQSLPADLIGKLAAVEGAEQVIGNVTDYSTFVVSKQGKLIGGQGAPGLGVNYTEGDDQDNPLFTMASGSAPAAAGEIVLDSSTVTKGGYAVGDTVSVVTAGAQAVITPKLVGIIEPKGSLVGASVVVWTTEQAQQLYFEGKDVFSDIAMTAASGTSQEQLRDAAAKVLPEGVTANTGKAVAEETQTQIQDSLKFITYFLLIFAAVSLVVGSFIIVNTFSILVAQRMRELALFRAIGASRRQVSRSVLIEALIVGLVGSTLGLAMGVLLALGIKQLFGAIGLDLSGADLVFAPRTVLAAYAVGLLVTLLAAYLPARRAGRIPPVAAMRDDVTLTESSMHRRVLLGGALGAAGAASMALGLFADVPRPVVWVGIGILGVLLGVAGTSPLVGRPVIAGLGAIYRRFFGTVGVMAEQNAIRNPRRTAATASALMIGVTLVSMMAVFGASTKQSIKGEIEQNFKADYLLSNAVGTDFSPSVGDQVAKLPEVSTVSRIKWGSGKFGGEEKWIASIDPATIENVTVIDMTQGRIADLTEGSVVLDEEIAAELKLAVGSRTTMELGGVPSEVTVAGLSKVGSGVPAEVLTSTETWLARGGTKADGQVYVLARDGADAAALGTALDGIVAKLPTVSVKDVQSYAAEQAKPIDQLLAIIYALLGLAVIIAILGIVNTLALSVIERTKEIGLLRAVGLSRRQLRSVLRLESIIIAVLGAVLGIVLGVLFGVAVQRALADEGFSTLSIPWVQLVGFLILAALVGVLAAVWPGRRAAKLQILDAIAAD